MQKQQMRVQFRTIVVNISYISRDKKIQFITAALLYLWNEIERYLFRLGSLFIYSRGEPLGVPSIEVYHNLFDAIIDLFRHPTTRRRTNVNLTSHYH